MARTVFTNANLVDGEHPAKPGVTVVVDGDRIVSVGAEQLAGTRPDDRVIDLAGRSLMPGMITCHYHSTYHELGSFPAPYGLEVPPAMQAVRAAKNLELALMCGFTGAVGAGAAHEIDASMKRAIDEGVIPGPRFVPSGRELSTTGHGNDNSPYYWGVGAPGAARLCDGPDEFRHAVRDEIKRGAEMIKLFVTGGHGTTAPKDRLEMSREELFAAVETAHSRDALIRGHIVSKPAILLALDAGMDVIDHADDLDDECIDRAAESGTFVAPSIYFPSAFLEQMGGRGLGFTDSIKADLEHMYEVLPAATAAGVKLVVGDDYGAVGFPHGRYANELEVYVRDAGIPPLEVIRWATKHGAELMRRGADLGTVSEGKLADLVVVDGDPLDDITVLQDPTRILAVMKGGEFAKDTIAEAPSRS